MRFTRSAILFASFALPLAVTTSALADSSCSAIADNLVVNCGFETGDFTGWTMVDPSGYSSVEYDENPHSGSYNAYLGAAPGSLSQTITDIAGQTYTLTFFLDNEIATDSNGVPFAGDNSFGVSVVDGSSDSTVLMAATSIVQSATYSQYSFTFVGTGSDTIVFSLDNEPSYYDIDDVSVVPQTPEPSSLALMGTGAIVCAAYTRRKMKNV